MGLALKSLVDLALIELRLSRICRFVVLGGPKEFDSKVCLLLGALHPSKLGSTGLASRVGGGGYE
jgi:hypothetical protein